MTTKNRTLSWVTPERTVTRTSRLSRRKVLTPRACSHVLAASERFRSPASTRVGNLRVRQRTFDSSTLTSCAIRTALGLRREGMDLADVQVAMGHKSAKTTARYAAIEPRKVSKAGVMIGRAWDEARGQSRGQRRKRLKRKPLSTSESALLSRGSQVRVLPGAPSRCAIWSCPAVLRKRRDSRRSSRAVPSPVTRRRSSTVGIRHRHDHLARVACRRRVRPRRERHGRHARRRAKMSTRPATARDDRKR